jgi:hypothetical protein
MNMDLITMRQSIIFFLAGVFWLAMLGGCSKQPNDPAPPDSPAEKPVEKPKEGPLVRSFQELAKEHLADLGGARVAEKYKDKVVEVEGVIYRVWPVRLGAYVSLRSAEPDQGFAIDLSIRRALRNRAAGSLSIGQKITVKGVYDRSLFSQDGRLIGFDGAPNDRMFLQDCEYVELSPSMLVTVKLEDLIKEIANDEAAARKKYGLKDLILEGNVVDLSRDPVSTAILNDRGPRVECVLEDEDFAALRKGQNARIRGRSFLVDKNRFDLSSAFVLPAK